MKRYVVRHQKLHGGTAMWSDPASFRWFWLAKIYAHYICGSWDAVWIFDTRTETLPPLPENRFP